ncbi:DNA polymerase III subunit gamma/tau [Enterobacteriaceae endosymbiont of Plateumaris consimilis]|uniref:DNA polymerase III subunit gamma/tau n=1 Tax=Enterobacteriaceae endosymbiont of Plateumaris consimilis TaxID=2675794 RepID=UPI001449A5B9|nr:DNA polymerase III subunit gamma/tau [Enterobacteriaceae endosymbiont of Plateumaris consimilis]QJC28742.1 DNA polymerase III subunit gamma/tau [Enterobacteriaceae endosymbiont of Plateumaris consimilis]
MTYYVLARKWRPQKFCDIIGQDHIVKAIKYSLSKKNIHPAWIFSGSRGVGKTTIARLFAMGLSCLNGITDDPCGLCENCKNIKNNSFLDLIELDSASKTKVEEIRDIIDNIQYKPIKSCYKIYIFDEFHMLSKHSFNALLKIIEEPPNHVKFIFVTTELQKIPITIISRCLQFHLKLITNKKISQKLKHILNIEKLNYDEKILDILSNVANGSMRDALSLTDQLISMGELTLKNIYLMLGLIKKKYLFLLISSLKKKNINLILEIIEQIASFNINWDNIIIEILFLLHELLKIKIIGSINTINNEYNDFYKNNKKYLNIILKNFSLEEIRFIYKTFIIGRKNLNLNPNNKIGFEVIIFKLIFNFSKI